MNSLKINFNRISFFTTKSRMNTVFYQQVAPTELSFRGVFFYYQVVPTGFETFIQ